MARYPHKRNSIAKHRKKQAAVDAKRPRQCGQIREGDEYACWCGIRWATDEDRPKCNGLLANLR